MTNYNAAIAHRPVAGIRRDLLAAHAQGMIQAEHDFAVELIDAAVVVLGETFDGDPLTFLRETYASMVDAVERGETIETPVEVYELLRDLARARELGAL